MRLVKQAIKTPDGTVIESRHRHNFVTHTDSVTGELYVVDGGIEYKRQGINTVPATDLSVYLEDGIESVRRAVTWGTYGKYNDQPLRLVLLSEMSNEHIEACLTNQGRMHPHYREAFVMELEYRKTNGITISDR